jgi:hypothetical protein
MEQHLDHESPPVRPHCCPCGECGEGEANGLSRRDFLKAGGIVVGGLAMTGLAWSSLKAEAQSQSSTAPAGPPQRQALVVKPILTYDTPGRRPKTSWRSWGAVQTREDADKEVSRIREELDKLRAGADFPVDFLPVSAVRGSGDMGKLADLASADVLVIYAAGGGSGIFDAAVKTGKHVIIFLRHKSGPVYLWYEIISPRYLHQHTDKLAVQGVDNQDVVVDSPDELAWRLRALCGLKNALGTKIVAIGGASGWGPSGGKAPELSKAKWKLDIHTVSYEDLGKLIKAARGDAAAVQAARDGAAAYLKDAEVKLETEKTFVENAFLLQQVFLALMNKAGARAITVNACMGAIMPIAETTACLTLSLLNDAGYMAFCESDFVVIPSGILLACISGKPQFLNDPTYPHDGVITLAHCTAPRRMDGTKLEPARILTHFESDYGAAPKVEMKKGQKVTMVIPDFAFARWVGLSGEIVDAPFLAICRSQIDVAYKVPDAKVAENMPGFHWEMVYGDYLREVGYALKKIPIAWECLG